MRRIGRYVYDNCVLPVARGVVSFGSHWVHVPPTDLIQELGLLPDAARLVGPPPGHPERLCPEVPLSAVESELARALSA